MKDFAKKLFQISDIDIRENKMGGVMAGMTQLHLKRPMETDF